jgi:hypothetical protein
MPRKFHLKRMMEKLAIHDGDVDGRVEVMTRDLSHAYDFLEIAQVLADAGRPDDALAWARRGLHAFDEAPRGPDTRLDDFVLAALQEWGESAHSHAGSSCDSEDLSVAFPPISRRMRCYLNSKFAACVVPSVNLSNN